MTKILSTTEIKDYCYKLLTIPSFYKNLEQYDLDEVYNYALNLKYERENYWSGAVDSPTNQRTAALAGYNESRVLEYLLTFDCEYSKAKAIIRLIENENQKKIDTEKLTKKKKQNNLIEVRRMYVFYFGLLHTRGKFYLGHINQEELDEQIKERLNEIGAKDVSAQNVRRLLVGQFSLKGRDKEEMEKDKERQMEEEIIFVLHNKLSNRWEFKKDMFDLKSKKYHEAYDAAVTLIKRHG